MSYSDDELIDFITYPTRKNSDAQTQTEQKYTINKVITHKPEPTIGTPAKNCHTICKTSDAIDKLTRFINHDIDTRQVATSFKILTTINHNQNTLQTLLYLSYRPDPTEEHHEIIDLTPEITEIALHPSREGRIQEYWKRIYKKALTNLQTKTARGETQTDLKERRQAEENIDTLIRRLSKGDIIPHNWEFTYSMQHKPKERITTYQFRFNRKNDIRCTEIRKELHRHTKGDEIDDWEKEIKAITHNTREIPPLTDRMEALNRFTTWLTTLDRPAYDEYYTMRIIPSTPTSRPRMVIRRSGGPINRQLRMRGLITIKITNKTITDEIIQGWKNTVINQLHISYNLLDDSIKAPNSLPLLDDDEDTDDTDNGDAANPMVNLGGFQPLGILQNLPDVDDGIQDI